MIRDYELWRIDPCYRSVDWTTVNARLSWMLQGIAIDGIADDLIGEISRAQSEPSETDAEGLGALYLEPISITPAQLTNGGHRLAAILDQQVESVPGIFHGGSIGSTIGRSQVFPLAGPG